jgi:hypothetical protein
MRTAVHAANANALIKRAFGDSVNVAEVIRCVDLMADPGAKFRVPSIEPTLRSGHAGVEAGTKILHFGSFFNGASKQDEDLRTSTLIHEASHAFCGTVDKFDGTTWLPVDSPRTGDNLKIGCK